MQRNDKKSNKQPRKKQQIPSIVNQEMPADLLEIPEEIFLNHMALNVQDIQSLRLTSRSFSFFRKKSESNNNGKGDIYLLTDKIINFRINDAVEIAQKNPLALFFKICYEPNSYSIPGSSNLILLSPIQRAFQNLDSYMWSHLYDLIKDNPMLVNLYKEQLAEINAYFDIQPLVSAYKTYLNYLREEKPTFDQGEDNPKLDEAVNLFKQVRLAQDALPAHMICEMCRPGIADFKKYNDNFKVKYFPSKKFTWYEGQNANESLRFEINNNPPPPEKIILFIEGEGISPPFHNLTEMENRAGVDLGALVRFDYVPGAFCANAHGLGVESDKNAFLKLHETRYNELAQHKKLLLGFSNDITKLYKPKKNLK